ncbi:hypothetical protein PEC301899_08130 [Pectobacterium carotovorum subsp. carotovorum]|nr:hypothetical protein PEC301899_08130 [Pectobacterium carotovorum subsp. carotovorum]
MQVDMLIKPQASWRGRLTFIYSRPIKFGRITVTKIMVE